MSSENFAREVCNKSEFFKQIMIFSHYSFDIFAINVKRSDRYIKFIMRL